MEAGTAAPEGDKKKRCSGRGMAEMRAQRQEVQDVGAPGVAGVWSSWRPLGGLRGVS